MGCLYDICIYFAPCLRMKTMTNVRPMKKWSFWQLARWSWQRSTVKGGGMIWARVSMGFFSDQKCLTQTLPFSNSFTEFCLLWFKNCSFFDFFHYEYVYKLIYTDLNIVFVDEFYVIKSLKNLLSILRFESEESGKNHTISSHAASSLFGWKGMPKCCASSFWPSFLAFFGLFAQQLFYDKSLSAVGDQHINTMVLSVFDDLVSIYLAIFS